MAMLSRAELNSCRSAANKALDQIAQVYRASQARDSGGGSAESWATAGKPVPCRLWTMMTTRDVRTEVIAGKLTAVTEWKCAFPAGSDVKAYDKLAIDGDWFDVIGTQQDASSPISLVALCRKTLNGC